MPITKSAEKALRQSVGRHTRNLVKSTEVKKLIKSFRKAIADGKTEEAKKSLSLIYKKLDKAVKSGVFKTGTVRRIKSRLAKKIK
jgi:small subunit ribosomal protein S20